MDQINVICIKSMDIPLNLESLQLFGGIISVLVSLGLGLGGCAILRKLLGVRKEFRSTRNVLPQDLWNLDTLNHS